MSQHIYLLGHPSIDRGSDDVYRFRSRKSWGLLAYLILRERPPTRSQLASLLFAEADDPLRALRWGLSEIRRALGSDASLEGDPVVLALPAGTLVDVQVVTRGLSADAVRLPGLGAELLDGMAFRDAAAFESWLLSEQRHIAAASEAILHEAALSSMSLGALEDAIDYAVRVVGMNPLEENHQALLIRLYRMAGDEAAAQRQFAACTDMFTRELGLPPGPAVQAAMSEPVHRADDLASEVSVDAIVEAGSAAISAGAVEAGVLSLRSAVVLADGGESHPLRATSRIALAEALIHSMRGLDEEGSAILHTASQIALEHGRQDLVAQARAELGYVDFLRARYDRAELWLTDALCLAGGSGSLNAKILAVLGSVESDRADYGKAFALLEEAAEASRAVADLRREAYAVSMLGRIHLLRRDLDQAADTLDAAIRLSERGRWLAFMPWPQALRGEVELVRGHIPEASEMLQQAFARACQLGDPCWEGLAARGLALLADAKGDTERAFEIIADARVRCNRLADTYIWMDGYILDAQCALGRQHGHIDTEHWIDSMRDLASRTGMKEFIVRALLHGAAIGRKGDAAAARLLAADIDNPALDQLVDP